MVAALQRTLSISGPETDQVFTLLAGTIVLGRQAGNDVVLPSTLVSREHARIVCDESGCYAEDLGSSNGTLLNTALLQPQVPHPLQDGDVLEIGPFQLTFRVAEAAERAPSSSGPALQVPDESDQLLDEFLPDPSGEPAEPGSGVSAPPPNLPVASQNGDGGEAAGPPSMPPGLDRYSVRYLQYLPPIYHTDFMSRFVAMFESIMMPVEWTVDGFDLFLDPKTAPAGFLPWLSNWFEMTFDDTWCEHRRREFLQEAHAIYARRGTRWALARILEIYTGVAPEIDDAAPHLEPLTFTVRIPLPEEGLQRELVESLIDANKPAHTTYQLTFGDL